MFNNDSISGLTSEGKQSTLSPEAKENRYSMRGFTTLEEWELWKYCNNLTEDCYLDYYRSTL